MTQRNLLPCDIVVLPEPALAQSAIQASAQLLMLGSAQFTLKDGVYFPHLSLYMLKLGVSELERAAAALEKLAQAFLPQRLEARRYHQAAGYFDIEYARTAPLNALQMAAVEAINPLRAGMMDYEASLINQTAGPPHENLKRYGFRAIGELFRPHITLTRFSGNHAVATAALPAPGMLSGAFPRLGLFEVDDNGACIRKLAEYNFGPQ